jgi:uncharacterized repeat protein (TIGR03803 family)
MTSAQISRQFAEPKTVRKRGSVSKLGCWKAACTILLLTCVVAIPAAAQNVTVLTSLGWDYWQRSALIQGADGSFYGTTYAGGDNRGGSVFKISPSGEATTLYSFGSASSTCCPRAALVPATDGNFYGTTWGYEGVPPAVFKITPSGTLTTLYHFVSNDVPGALVQGVDGNFYGTTPGTIFKVTPAGELTTLHTFCSQTNCVDGSFPWGGALVQGSDGNFYGTTALGGAGQTFAPLACGRGCGTVFRITPAGQFTTLYRFCSVPYCADGISPFAGLIQATDGNFYGTTSGFDFGGGSVSTGTLFKITSAGKFTVLHRFCKGGKCTDGAQPNQIIQANDGEIYGTTFYGGVGGDGTIFSMTLGGNLTTLYTFCTAQTNCVDGGEPTDMVQFTDGNFYGSTTALWGGTSPGTVFRMSMGLHPFVSFIRDSGKVGQTVQILGQGFTGTTQVLFNGTPASFTFQSDTYLTATVPVGAQWGVVTVTTPNDILKSNKAFRVTPQIFSMSTHSGPVATTVVLTGMTLARTYAITFGNVKATNYTVDSDTQVTVTVPPGAQSGKIAVLTPGGTAYSPTCFDVTP